MSASPESKSLLGVIVVASAAVVAWKIVALMLLRAQAQETELVLPSLLAVAGMAFLVCGLLVILKIPGSPSRLFVFFCICSALHWGGPLELAPGEARRGLILFYLLVSGLLSAVLLLRLTLEFPVRSRLAGRRLLVGLLYLPIGLATILVATSLAAPPESALRAGTQDGFLLLHTIVSNGFSLLALVLVSAHLFRGSPRPGLRRYAGLMVTGMLLAWLPYLVASAAGVENTDPWNLTVFALPFSFALAFFGIDGLRSAGMAGSASDHPG